MSIPRGNSLESLRRDAAGWCQGRSWALRAPLLLWFGWILLRHWGDPSYQSLFKPLNLGLHELGHLLLSPFGEFATLAGGSLVQCAAPLVAVVMFRFQGDFFAIAVSFGWLSTNLFDVATYVGDARSKALQLVTPFGGHPIHDWNYLLSRLGLLEWDGTFAFLLRGAATFTMLFGLTAGAWLLWRMFRARNLPDSDVGARAQPPRPR